MKTKNLISGICILAILFILTVGYVYATATNPTGPINITRDLDEKFEESNWPAVTIQAEAGNITALTITSLTQTQTWQGYYGDVSGTITLDDASNFTMYSWTSAEPQGEIYASTGSSVTWSSIRCVNYTNSGTAYAENITTIENMFGLASDDVDGVNETFNESGILSDGSTPHPEFWVGTYNISQGTCPATDTYEGDSSSGINFVEVLLTDNASIIFTTIIENRTVGANTGSIGFDNQTHDFQMIVGEDGHGGDDTITSYYFFVELE